MNWNSLPETPCPEWAGSDLKAEAETLEIERSAIVAERAALDVDRSKLQVMDAATVDPAILTGGDLRQRHAVSLQRELAYRQSIDRYLAAVATAANAEMDAAYIALQAIEGEIGKWLEKGAKALGGYNPPVEGTPVQGSWSREMILRHPAVIAGKARVEDARATWAADVRIANRLAQDAARKALERFKQVALAV